MTNSWAIAGTPPWVHMDGPLLRFSYDDTSVQLLDSIYALRDSTRLLHATDYLFTGLHDATGGIDSQVASLPYKWCPYTRLFARKGINDTFAIQLIAADGTLEIEYDDSLLHLQPGQSFVVVDSIIDTAYATYYNDGVWTVDSTTIWWIEGYCQTLTYRNVGLIKRENVRYP